MKHVLLAGWLRTVSGLVLFGLLLATLSARADGSLRVGAVMVVGNWQATVKRVEMTPWIENEYSKRFRYDTFDNPKLTELRQRHRLEEVIAPGRDEFERQVLLMDWVHRQFRRFGRPSTNCHGALAILGAVDEGHTFFCAQYAEVLVSASASLGWVDRPLALRRHQGVNRVGGSTEHSVTEIWSNQHAKWVMLDPTSDLYLERAGVPLNAYEIRQEWFYRGGTNLVFVVGRDRKKLRKTDLPIVLGSFPGFGELSVQPDELDKYGFIGYIPNTDLMNSGYDYAKMFIVKDELCAGTKWHVRDLPRHPASDPYFPLGQAALELPAADDGPGDTLRVRVRTQTPNFERFEARTDGGPWHPEAEIIPWRLHAGSHRLEVRTVNRFGVTGPISVVELAVAGK